MIWMTSIITAMIHIHSTQYTLRHIETSLLFVRSQSLPLSLALSQPLAFNQQSILCAYHVFFPFSFRRTNASANAHTLNFRIRTFVYSHQGHNSAHLKFTDYNARFFVIVWFVKAFIQNPEISLIACRERQT